MTDNDIIKALECCSKSGWLNDCDGCPCYDETEDIQTSECQERLMKNALDLINRQQKEIEQKQSDYEIVRKRGIRWMNKCKELQAEIERLRDYLSIQDGEEDEDWYTMPQLKTAEEIKSEAIKEFAEKINEVFLRYAHLHSRAEGARKDYIETVDEKEIGKTVFLTKEEAENALGGVQG